MTTLVGLTSAKGKPGVVLASDLTATMTGIKNDGDVFYKERTKIEMQKIHVDKNREVAVCMTGIADQLYTEFLYKLIDSKIDVRKAITDGFFKELSEINHQRWGNKLPNNDLNGLLLATRFDNKPELYTCYPLGLVEGRTWTTIGSGSKYADEHIARYSLSTPIPNYLSMKDGVDLAVSSLDKASTDLHTGGLDLVVITADGIKECGHDIKEAITNARNKVIQRIKRDYK